MTSWQTRVYLRLRDRGWRQIGALFEEFEAEIPLHLAMRTAVLRSPDRGELPTSTEARWCKFLGCLSAIGVETSGNQHKFKWADEVRLRYAPGRVCADCGGPVIRAGWTVHKGDGKIACLACEAALQPTHIVDVPAEQPAEPQQQPPPPIRPSTPARSPLLARLPGGLDPIGEAIDYVMLHRMLHGWGPPAPPRRAQGWVRAPPIPAPFYRITIHLGAPG